MDFHCSNSKTPQRCRRQFFTESGWALAALGGILGSRTGLADEFAGASNHLRLLSNDATSLLHRLQLIDSAEREILMSAYEVGDDCVAQRILAGLRQAARRGVDVKLLVDGHGTNNLMPKPLMAHLIAESVAIREHMPDVRYKLEIGRQRMHDKLMIVDGQRMIIGGRNVRADYYGVNCRADDKIRWDRDAYVRGPIVATARCYFLSRWNAGTSGQPTLDRKEKDRTVKAQQLAELNEMPRAQAQSCAARVLDEALSAGLAVTEGCCQHHGPDCTCEPFFDLSCVRFLHDIPEHPKDCAEAIAQQLNAAVAAAKESLLISTPYLVMSHRLRKILTTLRERGVDVVLLTNSLSTNDHTITHAQYANERRWMLRAGIELWEMKGPRMLHAKSMVIDGHRSMIGSYNFDMLSETRNSETALLIDDAGLAGALTAQIVEHLMLALPVDEPLIGFDARTNDVDEKKLRKMRTQRVISPWIKKYM